MKWSEISRNPAFSLCVFWIIACIIVFAYEILPERMFEWTAIVGTAIAVIVLTIVGLLRES